MLRWGVAAKAIPPPPTPALPRSRAVPSRSRRLRLRPRSAQKPTNEERGEGNALAGALSKRKTVLLRAGVALFALGFVDAGYSGDWSRIGAISKDTEELLKLGAYVVVPLCLALVLSASQDSSTD